ncbi:MAG TPA: hypothetical protein DDW76_14820 [Cyanobacteria bacterium UBA11369]|nr:hypothetical protein [Cyanobacteria bacterium UBA11371]HBE16317.1 hypothetical protein [Cyanobacteria bacterium UBA11367]HBE36098.1 hypothetical protein [Cyanobacteria bacterium UBA11368]HBE50030.1 hypothetical protein [Cyanobacteria bacterium UBA11369]
MPTNQPNNTQKNAADRLKSTRDKLTRKIKSALKNATPEETLEVWMLMKRQELKRTTPGLSEQQIESVVRSLILELGYDIIATSTTPLTATSQESKVQTDESAVDDLDEDNDADSTNDDLDEDDFSDVSEERIPSRKQRVPALRKVENLRSSTRNGKHS